MKTDDQIWVKVLGFRFYQPIFSLFFSSIFFLTSYPPTHPPTALLLHDFIASWFLSSRMTGFRQQSFLFVNLQLLSFAGARVNSQSSQHHEGWMDGWMDGWFVGRWVNEQSPVYLPLRSGWLPTYLQNSFFCYRILYQGTTRLPGLLCLLPTYLPTYLPTINPPAHS